MSNTIGKTPPPVAPLRAEANAPTRFGEAFKQSWRNLSATNKPLLALRILAWVTVVGGLIDLAVSAYRHALGKLGQGAQPATPSRLSQTSSDPAAAVLRRSTTEGFAGSEALSRMGARQLENHQQAIAQGAADPGRPQIPVTAEDRANVADYSPRDQALYFKLRQDDPTLSHDEALAIVFPPQPKAAPVASITAQEARDLAGKYQPTAQSTSDELSKLQTRLRNSQLPPSELQQLTQKVQRQWKEATSAARSAVQQQRKAAFDHLLAAQGLRPFEAGGGGHCMFHSMAHQLNGVRPEGHLPQQAVRQSLLGQLDRLSPAQQRWVADQTDPAGIATELTRLRNVLNAGIRSPDGGDSNIWGEKGHARLLALQTGRPVAVASSIDGVQVYHPDDSGRTESFDSPAAAGLARLRNENPPAITLYHTGDVHWQSVADVQQRPESSTDLPDLLADFSAANKALYRKLIADGQSPAVALDQVLNQLESATPANRPTTAATQNDLPEVLAGFPEASKALYRQLIADGQTPAFALNRVMDQPPPATNTQ